jgi:hypothetical protein
MTINEQADAIFSAMAFDVRLNDGMRSYIAAVFEVAALAFDEPLDLGERPNRAIPAHYWRFLDEAFQDGIAGATLPPAQRTAWHDAYQAAQRVLASPMGR